MSFFALAYEVSCRAGSEESSSGIQIRPCPDASGRLVPPRLLLRRPRRFVWG